MSAPKQNSIATRVMDHAFAGIVSLWPADSRDWARAMHAEFQQTTNATEKLSWLLGGAMSLTSAWTQRLAFGPRKTREAAAPKPVKKPGPLAFALMAVAMMSLALPGMWSGIRTIAQTWNGARVTLTQEKLDRLGQEAERLHDSKMLAFVATRIWDPAKSAHYADAAVALDQNLTWIYFETNGLGFMIHPTEQELLRRSSLLQKWDPNNAMPWLMEANIAFSRFRVISGNPQWLISSLSWNSAAEQLGKNPGWATSMQKAFAAGRYDDYVRRSYDLTLSVMREHGMDNPVELSLETFSLKTPNLLMMQVYSAGLIEDGKAREGAGDFAGASGKFWTVAREAEVMIANSAYDPFARSTAVSTALAMKQRAFESLLSIEQKTGRSSEAAFSEYQIASLERERAAILNSYSRRYPMVRAKTFESKLVHYSAQALVVSAIMAGLSFFAYALAFGFSWQLGKWACRIMRYAPVALVASLAVFYASYFPYADSFRKAAPDSIPDVVLNFSGVLFNPVLPIPYGRGPLYFWTVAMTVCCSALILVLARMAFRSRMEGAEA